MKTKMTVRFEVEPGTLLDALSKRGSGLPPSNLTASSLGERLVSAVLVGHTNLYDDLVLGDHGITFLDSVVVHEPTPQSIDERSTSATLTTRGGEGASDLADAMGYLADGYLSHCKTLCENLTVHTMQHDELERVMGLDAPAPTLEALKRREAIYSSVGGKSMVELQRPIWEPTGDNRPRPGHWALPQSRYPRMTTQQYLDSIYGLPKHHPEAPDGCVETPWGHHHAAAYPLPIPPMTTPINLTTTTKAGAASVTTTFSTEIAKAQKLE